MANDDADLLGSRDAVTCSRCFHTAATVVYFSGRGHCDLCAADVAADERAADARVERMIDRETTIRARRAGDPNLAIYVLID